MIQIRPWLYVGKYRDTIDRQLLQASGIGAMLELAEEVRHPGITSLYLPVNDGEPLAHELIQHGVAFVRDQRAAGNIVLVACGAGISRSVSFIMAALVEEEQISLLDAYRSIRRVHALAMPNPALVRSLHEYYQAEGSFDDIWHSFGWDNNLQTKPLSKPVLVRETERLFLRPLMMSDVDTLHRLSNNPNIAANLSDMPYPYPREAAVGLVNAMHELAGQGTAYAFGLELRTRATADPASADTVIGVVYLIITLEHRRGELIYWIGQPYWGQGYATEAVREVLRYGFEYLTLHRIHASYFVGNAASARVLEKVGMKFEGVQRKHLYKDGQFIDLGACGMLRAEYSQNQG